MDPNRLSQIPDSEAQRPLVALSTPAGHDLNDVVVRLRCYEPNSLQLELTGEDLCRNSLFLGTVGSGKTTTMNPLLRDLIFYRASDPQRRIGLLVIDSKMDETVPKIQTWANAAGRQGDLQLLSPSSEYYYDFLADVNSFALIDEVVDKIVSEEPRKSAGVAPGLGPVKNGHARLLERVGSLQANGGVVRVASHVQGHHHRIAQQRARGLPAGFESRLPAQTATHIPTKPITQVRAQLSEDHAGAPGSIFGLMVQSLEERDRIGDPRRWVEQTSASLQSLVGMDVEGVGANPCRDLIPVAEKQPADVRPAQFRTTRLDTAIAVAHGGPGQGAELASLAQTPAQMPTHRAGRLAFLGRVPNLDELQMNRLLGTVRQFQRKLLREPLQLPPAQARQRQRAQEGRSSNTRWQQVPPPEAPRPKREIIFTIVEVPDVRQQEPFEVHLRQPIPGTRSLRHFPGADCAGSPPNWRPTHHSGTLPLRVQGAECTSRRVARRTAAR